MKPNRSVLSVPGHIEKMHVKAAQSEADVIMLDLEDSVPQSEKDNARNTALNSIKNIDWKDNKLILRINATDTAQAYRDLLILENTGDRVESVVVPKVNSPEDLHFVSKMLDGIELAKKVKCPCTVEAIIESAQGLLNIYEIAASTPRMHALVFGIADYSTSIGAKLVSISGHGENEDEIYPGHRWHYQLSKIVLAAKSKGLLAIDAAYGNFKDIEGLVKSCTMGTALGLDGKWAIHPDQVETINNLFSPSAEELEIAGKIIKASIKAEKENLGAVAVEGRMVDIATLTLAKKTWSIALKLGIANENDI